MPSSFLDKKMSLDDKIIKALKGGPLTINELFTLLKTQGYEKSKRTLQRHISRLIKIDKTVIVFLYDFEQNAPVYVYYNAKERPVLIMDFPQALKIDWKKASLFQIERSN